MLYLRQSTASQEVPLGYFVDSTDGNTEETGLTINNTDIKIWKTGATTLASKNSGGATHISNGLYYAVLDATDTDTIGPLVVFVHVTGALTVRVECCVLDEAVYDTLFGTTALSTYAAGAVASVTGAVGSVTGNVGGNVVGSIGSLATQAKADVNAECDTAVSDYGPLKPTVAGRTLDVTGTGAAGVDWGNVENQTTANALTATTISTSQAVASVSGSVGSVTGAVGSVTAAVTVGTNTDKSGYALSTAGVQAIWDALTSALTAVGSVGKLLVDMLNASVTSRLAAASYTAPPSANDTADAVLDRADALETGWTVRKALRVIFAVLGGKSDGFGGSGATAGHFRDVLDSKNRVTVAADQFGNRSSVTLDGD